MKTHYLFPMFITAILLLPVMLVCKTPDIRLPKNEGKQIFSSSNPWPDSIAKSTMNEHYPFRISKSGSGGPSPNLTDNEVIRWDNGINFDAAGITGGGIFDIAAYFPASTMEQYTGMALNLVEIYIGQNPINCTLNVYGQGTPNSPGSLIHSQPVTSPTSNSWNLIDLSNQVDITGQDLWISFSFNHLDGTSPAGIDAGPAIAGYGDMISFNGGSWTTLTSLGYSYNWNIAGYLDTGGVLCPIVNAGPDATICDEGVYTLTNAFAMNCSGLQWITTNGTGFFDDENILNASYSPSFVDYISGSVELCLYGSPIAPCTIASMDCMNLFFQATTTANAGVDASICQGSTHQLAGSTTNYASVLWTTSGTGTFNSASSLTAIYTPGAADITAGTVTLTLTASAISPCAASTSDNKILVIQKTPTANAGTNATICQGSTHTLSGSATNYASLLWTTSGTGTFSSTTILSPIYTPSAADIIAGTVTLTLTASAISPCTTSASSSKTLTIQKTPTANAGVDATICQTGTRQLSGSATNYASVLWTTSGNGTFSSTTILNPIYTPGTTDFANGTVTLTLTATAAAPYTGAATDNMVLTIQKSPTANAGVDATVCQGSTHQLSGTAQYQSSVLWTTSGTGTFNSASSLTAIYTPGAADITAGTVTLTLTASAIAPCTVSSSDNKILVIQKTPTANAGTNATICQGSTHTLSGSATNYASLLWTTSGTGTFSSTTILSPIYTPSAADITAGTVTLTLTASAIAPCTTAASSSKTLTIQKTPTANAGVDATICQTGTRQLSGSATNYASVFWTTSGNGTFSSTTILNAIYTPGTTDITNGTVTLTLTAMAAAPCTGSATDNMVLTIQKSPTANAGVDATLCQGSTHQLAGTATNYASLLWTTSGTGTFNNTSTLNAIYTPGAADIAAGTVTLTLTASAIAPCTVSSSDNKILVIQKTPTANAGTNASICQGSMHELAGNAANYASLLWTTSGTGTFSSTTILSPVYTPGAADITAGTVTLTLTASAVSPCTTAASSSKTLTIQKTPTANAGLDATICQTGTRQLSGSATNYASVLWTTSGNGTFSSTTILNPVYTPGTTDIANGTVTLTLTAMAAAPCTGTATDNMVLTIQKSPTANAGVDATVCQGSTHQLSGTAQYQSSVLWTTSGTGTFNSASSLTAIYTPGAADITAGTVTLTLTASAIAPCTVSSSDNKILVIQKTPTANAGTNATICQGSTHQLAGTATTYASLLWTTSGTGTFSSASSLTAIYTPGAADITAGKVTLTITVLAISPCTAATSDSKNLVIQKTPTANAGTNASFCQGSTHQLEATAANYSQLFWVSYGTGSFDDPTILNPVYTPGVTDLLFGSVELCLNVAPINPCAIGVTDCLILTMQSSPTAHAGGDAEICEGNSYELLEATSANYSQLLWITYGTGYFDDPTILNPVYYPSPIELLLGSVELCLNVAPLYPCSSGVTDCVVLTFQAAPEVNAGDDATICEGEPYDLVSATATNYNEIQWYSLDGSGFFSDENILNPIYYPSQLDFAQGCIHIGLLATAIAPCSGAAQDEIELCFQPIPLITCPFDLSVCISDPMFALTSGVPAGGIYSGTGVIVQNDQYLFNPAIGIGSYTITYCYTEPVTGCGNCCEFIITVNADHIIQIPNGWSGISSYIAPVDPDIEVMFSPIINELTILNDLTGIYYPAGSVNTITNWNVYSGYVIKVNENTNLPICGNEVLNKSINLTQGWNLIPVLSSEAYNIEDLFTGVNAFQIAKDVAGVGVYWKEYGINTINDVQPGKAYYVRMNGPGSIDYSLPGDNLKSGIPAYTPELLTPWNLVTHNPASHIVAFHVANNQFESGDIIGAFTTDGWCAGNVGITDPMLPFAISLNGGDLYSSENDGFEPGEALSYKLFRPTTGEIFNLMVSYDPQFDQSGLFVVNGLSVITDAKILATNIAGASHYGLQIYPNPCDGIFTLDGIDKNVKIAIFNAFGQKIYHNELKLPSKLDLSTQPKGIYLISIETDNNMFFEKLVIN